MDEKKTHRIFHLYASRSDQGIISGEFESGHNGPGTISSGKLHNGAPDAGGVSYGIYQFTSQDVGHHHHIVHNGGTAGRFINSNDGQQWRDEFKDANGHALAPGSKEFSEKWASIAKNQAEEFAAAQQSFVGKHYYTPQADRLQGVGVDVENRSTTLQNVVWSTSVQHGASNPLMEDAVREKAEKLHVRTSQLTDEQCIDAIYEKRAEEYPTDAGRYEREHSFAKQMLHQEHTQQQELHGGVHSNEQSLAPVPPVMSRVAANEASDLVQAGAQIVGGDTTLAQVPEQLSHMLHPEKADLEKNKQEVVEKPHSSFHDFNPLAFRMGNG